MIHVCFGLHDKDGRYSKFTGTAMLSMFENTTSEVTVHILHDNTLTQDNRDKFFYIAGYYGQIVEFHNVDEICKTEIAHLKELFSSHLKYERFTFGAVYRLLIPQTLSECITKVIYIDSDTIINLDIKELWKIDLINQPLAAVPENASLSLNVKDDSKKYFDTGMKKIFGLCKDGFVNPKDYFNNGVMILNLKQLRENEQENILNGINFLAKNFQYQCFDQEIFNYCFSKNYLKLKTEYNFSVLENKMIGRTQIKNRILHYIGNILNSDMRDKYNQVWFYYFEKTPWFNKNVIANLDTTFRKKDADLKKFALQMTALISGKRRAFFSYLNIDLMKKIFLVRDDEEFIQFVNQESLNALAKSMFESRGKKVFFILFERYTQLRVELKKLGFVENQDFIDAQKFLSDANGVPLNTYELVKAM